MSLGPDDYHRSAHASINDLIEQLRFDIARASGIGASLNLAGHPALKVEALKAQQLLEEARARMMHLKEIFTMECPDESDRQRDDRELPGGAPSADVGGVGPEVQPD